LSKDVEPFLSDNGPLAVICGGGNLPLAMPMRRPGRGVASFYFRFEDGGSHPGGLSAALGIFGNFGSFWSVARGSRLPDVGFIGSLVRPGIPLQLRPDLKTLRLLPKIWRMFRAAMIR
jgi:DUF1009 family protein